MGVNEMKKHFNKWHGCLLLCFLIPMELMLIGYLCRGVFPMGDNSVLVLDLNAQYIYYFEAFRQAIYEGKSLLYSWSQSLSGELIGIYGYYLSSPFTLIILLFPKEYITEAVLVMTVMKVATAGLGFGYYLYKSKPMKPVYIVTMSVMYAMMSYVIVNAMNPMWLDAVILLPIIILGVERLADNGKYTLYFASLSAAMLANYYIGYMICVFTAIYFIVYLISTDKITGIKCKLKRLVRFGFISILAACAAAVIIIPIYYSLTLGKMGFSAPNYKVFLRYDFLDLLPKLLINSYDSVNVQGMPFIYCGSLALFLLPLYFVTPQIKLRKKVATAVMIAVVFAIMNISLADIAMHGFRVPNWLNYRYSFTMSFLILSASAEALRYIAENSRSKIFKTFAALLAVLALVQYLKLDYVKIFGTVYLSIAVFGIYAFVLAYIRSGKQQKIAAILLLSCVSIEAFSNALVTFEDINQEVWYSSRSSYTDFIGESRPIVNQVLEEDGGLYRMEKTYHRTVNDPMALKMNGVSHSTSTLNADALRFLKKLGISQREHWSHYSHTSILTDSILGIKYILSKKNLTKFYDKKFTSNEVSVYENPYALPIVFAVTEDYGKKTIGSLNPFEYQNNLMNALLGERNVEYFKRIEVASPQRENVSASNSGLHDRYMKLDDKKSGYIEYSLKTGNNPIYCFFASDYSDTANLSVNDEFVSDYFNTETYCVMPIGEYSANKNVKVKLELNNTDLYIRKNGAYFYYLDMELFTQAINRLKMGALDITKHTDTNIEGIMNTQEDKSSVFTSIPYEGGWTIKVDGVKVQPYKGAQSLIAFDVTSKGEHHISMRFVPPGLVQGAVISIIALIIFALTLTLDRLNEKRKREKKIAAAIASIHADNEKQAE